MVTEVAGYQPTLYSFTAICFGGDLVCMPYGSRMGKRKDAMMHLKSLIQDQLDTPVLDSKLATNTVNTLRGTISNKKV